MKASRFRSLRSITGDNQMKRLVLTFVSTAAVCAVVSAAPAGAQNTVMGAPAGTAPVTIEGYGNSPGYNASSSTPAIGAAESARPPQLRRPSDARLLVTLMTLRQGTRLSAVPDRPARYPMRAAPFRRRTLASVAGIRDPSGVTPTPRGRSREPYDAKASKPTVDQIRHAGPPPVS